MILEFYVRLKSNHSRPKKDQDLRARCGNPSACQGFAFAALLWVSPLWS